MVTTKGASNYYLFFMKIMFFIMSLAIQAPIKNPEEYVAVIPYKDIFKLFSLLNKTVQHRRKRRRRPPPRPHPTRRMSTTSTTTTTKRPTTKAPKPRRHRMPKPRRTTRAATTTTHRPKKIVKVRSEEAMSTLPICRYLQAGTFRISERIETSGQNVVDTYRQFITESRSS